VDPLAILLAVGATLNWAVTWLLMKVGVDRMSWVGFGFLRPWMGLPFILLFAWATGGFTFGSPLLVLVGLGSGLLNAVFGTSLFYYAHSHGTLHETNILANTSPFWGVVSAILFLGEPARLVTFGAGVLVIAGTIFLVRNRSGERERRNLRASLAALGAGVLWGFSIAVPTKFCMDGGMSPIAYQLLFTCSAAGGWSVVAAPSLWRRRLRFDRRSLWIAFVSAFTGLFAGWVLWLVALQRIDASALSPLNSLTLLFAVILGVVVLRERITRRIVIGGALIAAGVTLVSLFAR
jgi:drug/metabolite transporter (DMT)-like permease